MRSSTDGEISSEEETEISFNGANNNATVRKGGRKQGTPKLAEETINRRESQDGDVVQIHAPTNDQFGAERLPLQAGESSQGSDALDKTEGKSKCR